MHSGSPNCSDVHRSSLLLSGSAYNPLMESDLSESTLLEIILRLWVSQISDRAIFLINESGILTSWNPAVETVLGYTKAEWIGQPASMVFTPEDVASGRFEAELDVTVSRGHSADKKWHVRRDGSRVFIDGEIYAVRDAGRLIAFIKLVRNGTEEQLSYERTTERLRALTKSLLSAQDEERRRMGRDLHDDLLQRFTMLQLSIASAAEQIGRDNPAVRQVLSTLERQVLIISEETRRLAHQLHPSVLDELGFVPAIESLCTDFTTQYGTHVRFVLLSEVPALRTFTAAALYRIVQEALQNVYKHAGDASAVVALAASNGWLQVEITDSGTGFDPAGAVERGGLGLISMRERAEILGGTFRVHSSPGKDTEVEVRVPVNE